MPDYKVKDNNSRRGLRLNEISEGAADCLFWWNKGMARSILEFLAPFAQDAFDTGIFNIIGDDPTYSEQSIKNRIYEVAQTWSDILLNPLDRSAPAIGRRLANMLETWKEKEQRDFWRGHLGQLVFYRDGFPMRELTRDEVAGVLGTNVRRIAELVQRGKLTELNDSGEKLDNGNMSLISRSEVVNLWNERTGLQVGNARLLRIG